MRQSIDKQPLLTDYLKKLWSYRPYRNLQGIYNSRMRGIGSENADVRPYQIGDDLRLIDWKTTARLNTPYIRTFHAEQSLNCLLFIDLAPSLSFGSIDLTKWEWTQYAAALIAQLASDAGDQVGAFFFDRQVRQLIPPRRGKRACALLVEKLEEIKPNAQGETSMKAALLAAKEWLKKPSHCFIFSDCWQPHFVEACCLLDRYPTTCTVVCPIDPAELLLPNWGTVKMQDLTTGQKMYVNTADPSVQQMQSEQMEKRLYLLEGQLNEHGIHFYTALTQIEPLESLTQLFSYKGRGTANQV